jgi:hypothetical protein
MRKRLIGLLGVLALATSCSSPPAEVRGAELRTAPPVTVADTTVASTTPVTTVAPTTSTTTPTATTIAATSLKSEDELKIEYVITEYNRRDFKERVDRTFDIAVYGDLIAGDQLAATKRALEKRKGSTRLVLPGTITEAITIDIVITADSATATACKRNDLQVWDSKGTPDRTDDTLIDGTLLIERESYGLQKRGDSWAITQSGKAVGDCSSAF